MGQTLAKPDWTPQPHHQVVVEPASKPRNNGFGHFFDTSRNGRVGANVSRAGIPLSHLLSNFYRNNSLSFQMNKEPICSTVLRLPRNGPETPSRKSSYIDQKQPIAPVTTAPILQTSSRHLPQFPYHIPSSKALPKSAAGSSTHHGLLPSWTSEIDLLRGGKRRGRNGRIVYVRKEHGGSMMVCFRPCSDC
jgi:hypothetical protein